MYVDSRAVSWYRNDLSLPLSSRNLKERESLTLYFYSVRIADDGGPRQSGLAAIYYLVHTACSPLQYVGWVDLVEDLLS